MTDGRYSDTFRDWLRGRWPILLAAVFAIAVFLWPRENPVHDKPGNAPPVSVTTTEDSVTIITVAGDSIITFASDSILLRVGN